MEAEVNWQIDILLVFVLITVLLASGMWIPFTIGLTGIGLLLWSGGLRELNALGLIFWGGANSFVLTAIPLFILMAEILIASNISAGVYRGLARFTRYLPGGLLLTNIAGCAAFSAVCGSSVATAAAIARVSLPEMRSQGYDMRSACGSLAAGGTLGILIPPSGAMIIYGVLTDTSISRLFSAGILPGLILAGMFMAFIALRARGGMREAAVAVTGSAIADLIRLVPFLALILVVIGSIYLGIATPTEAAALGVLAAGVIGATVGELNFARLMQSLHETVRVSGALLLIIAMAQVLSYALSTSGIAGGLAAFIAGLGLSKIAFLVLLVVLYAILGCIMDGVAMTMITVPVLFPVIKALGIDPVFFGVFLVVMMELGLITPPFGLNLFVIQQISGEPMGQVLKGSLPYCLIIFLFIALLLAFPGLTAFVPG